MTEFLRLGWLLRIFLAICITGFLATACERGEDVNNLNLHRRSEIIQSRTPIPLRKNEENKNARCAAKLYDMPEPEEDTPEYHRCKGLQKGLNKAAWDGDIKEIRKALEDGANVNAGYYQQGSPLGMAIVKGRAEAVRMLVENGAEVNVDYIFGGTPLKEAVQYDFVEIVEFLIENGADVCSNRPDDLNRKSRALDIAKEKGHEEMIRLLKSAGADSCP